jgi:hypothetical protein
VTGTTTRRKRMECSLESSRKYTAGDYLQTLQISSPNR